MSGTNGRSSGTGRPPSHVRALLAGAPELLRRGGRAVGYTSTHLAAVAAVEVAVAMHLLSLPPSPAPLVVGLITFAVYNADRLTDVDADALAAPDRTAFVRRHRDLLYLLASVAYGLAVSIAVLGGPIALGITLFPAVFWILYATDWVPDVAGGFDRLKDVFVLNTVVVALPWAVTVTTLPLAFADASVSPAVGPVLAYFFLRSFVDTEVPNVGDAEGDRAAGVSTLPTVFGVSGTRRLLSGVDLLTAVVVGYAVLRGDLSLALATALLAGIAYSLGVTSLLGRVDEGRVIEVATECEYLVVAAVLLLFGLGV